MAKRNHMSTAQKIIAYSAITVETLAFFCLTASSTHIVLVYHVFPLLGGKFSFLTHIFDETFCLSDTSEQQHSNLSQGSSGTIGIAISF